MILCLSFKLDLLNHIYTFRNVNVSAGSTLHFLSNIFCLKMQNKSILLSKIDK